MMKSINRVIIVEIGIVSLGKYTLPNSAALPVKVADVIVKEEAKNVHVILPSIKNKNDGTPPGASPAMEPNTKL